MSNYYFYTTTEILARVENFKMTFHAPEETIDDATAHVRCSNVQIVQGGDGQKVVAHEHKQ